MRLFCRLLLAFWALGFLASETPAQPPDTLWTRTYGTAGVDIGYAVHRTFDGGYVVAGCRNNLRHVFKTDADGGLLWSHDYGATTGEARAVIETADSSLMVLGWFRAGPPDSSLMWLQKMDASGETVWSRTYRHSAWVLGYALHQTPDHGYFLAGYEQGQMDMLAIKVDSAGNPEWLRTFGGSSNECCYGADVVRSGGYALFG